MYDIALVLFLLSPLWIFLLLIWTIDGIMPDMIVGKSQKSEEWFGK